MSSYGGLLLTVILFQLVSVQDAARRINAHDRARETVLQRRNTGTLERREDTNMNSRELFRLTAGEELVEITESADRTGTIVERLQETYEGVPVYDGFVTVRKTKDGVLTGDATGVLIQDIDKDLSDTGALLTDAQTLRIAVEAEGDVHLLRDIFNIRYNHVIFTDKKDLAHLANVVSYLIDGVKRPYYIIDLKNGEILRNWQGLTSYPCCTRNYVAFGGNERTGQITYGDMPYCLMPTIMNDTCFLENEYVRVVDMSNDIAEHTSDPAYFNCRTGYEDAVNGAYSPAVDAFFYGTVVGKMYDEWFDSRALREKIILRVHYGDKVENAFWDSEMCTFGDGENEMYPLTSLDVISHEIAHGVTEQSSNLEYQGESGGVNEAFSDIMGEVAEAYLLGSNLLTGTDVMKRLPFMREFEVPEKDNESISNVDDMTEDIDVHHSSGIYRRIWYVLVVNEEMAIRDAASVFLRANRIYWHNTATFHDCSCGLLMAALDLGFSTVPFRRAFKSVGLKRCDLEKHVFTLKNNRTHVGIEVSKNVHPVFRFETPLLADQVQVIAVSESGKNVKLTVTENGWELSNDCQNAKLLAEGLDKVTISSASDMKMFITLSLDGTSANFTNVLTNVNLTVAYTCESSLCHLLSPDD